MKVRFLHRRHVRAGCGLSGWKRWWICALYPSRLGPHRGSQPAVGGIYHPQGIAEAGTNRDNHLMSGMCQGRLHHPYSSKKTYSINATICSQNNVSLELQRRSRRKDTVLICLVSDSHTGVPFNREVSGRLASPSVVCELQTLEMIRPGRAISLAIAGLNIVRPGPALLWGRINALPPRTDAVSIR